VGSRGYLDCAELIELLDRPAAKVDRSMGDIHPTGNPHYLFDPRAAERVAVGIGKRFAELDPEGQASYLAQTKTFVTKLREARARWEQRLAAWKGSEVITFHRSLVYLADWLGLKIVGEVEPRPGIPPNPGHVAELISRAKQQHVRGILQERYYPSNTSDLIAQKIGAPVLRVPGATNFQQNQSYIAFLDQIVSLVERAK
jgi:zinc/manganese transport system substrate-binding protein